MNGSLRTEHTALLERDAEREALDAALARARGGAGTLTAVVAHAGLGKSRLLDHAITAAGAEGMQVLAGRGGETERDFAFGVALQLFEPALTGAAPAERDALLTGSAHLAAPLFAGARPAGGPEALASLVHGLFWLTTNLAEREPLAIVVDDAHWADAPTLRFLRYLAQRLDDLRVAVVLAVRAGDPGAGDVAGLLSHPLARVVEPRPLGDTAVAELVRAGRPEADDEFCRACAEATGGNPFLVEQLLATVAVAGLPAGPEAAVQVRGLAPESVARAILMRLAHLPTGAGRLARMAAVLGDGASPEVAARLAQLNREDAGRAAQALVDAQVLEPGPTLDFVHPVVREAVYADVAPAERAAAHATAAELLTAAGEPPERVARHLLEASPAGDPTVVAALRAAASAAMAGGTPGVAVRLLRRAEREPPSAQARAEVLLELGHAEAAAGEPEAATRLESAIAALDDPGRRAEASLTLGNSLYASGRLEAAAHAYDAGIEALEGDGNRDDAGAGTGTLAARLEAGYQSAGRLVPELRSRVRARLAPWMARPPRGETHAERALLASLALEATLDGHSREAAAALARRAWGEGALLREETADGPALQLLTSALLWAEEPELDVEVLDAAIDDARRRGSVMAFATASYGRGAALRALGRLPEAIADLEAALDARRYGWEMHLPDVHAHLALAHLDGGDSAGAQAALELDDEARWRGSLPHLRWLEARGAVRLARNDAAGALEDLLAAGRGLVDDFGLVNPATSAWRSRAALAAAHLGDLDRSRALSDDELARARAYGAPRALGIALRARGVVEGDAGLPFLEEAVAVLDDSPARLDFARASLDLGSTLRRAGRRQDSRAPLAAALEAAERCGARALAERAGEELRVAGARPHRAHHGGSDALTPSELRVAQLAAQGRTNREIAEALFVTMKTVEWHLRHAYRKLDVPSREHLAQALMPDESA